MRPVVSVDGSVHDSYTGTHENMPQLKIKTVLQENKYTQ